MFVHAVIGTFEGFQNGTKAFGSIPISAADLETLFYKRVICATEWADIYLEGGKKRRTLPRAPTAPPLVAVNERL